MTSSFTDQRKKETKRNQWQQTTQITKTLPLNKMLDYGRPSATFLIYCLTR